MIKKWYFFLSLIAIVTYASLSFKKEKKSLSPKVQLVQKEIKIADFPSKDSLTFDIPFTKNEFIGFKEAVAQKESRGKYKKVNSLGYLGKYQFGVQTLKAVGVKSPKKFLNSPELQEKAFVALLSKNKHLLEAVIEKHEGSVVDGILITESGILAAAHLAGAGSVKKFFRYNGKRFFKDAYGTSLRSYLKKFGGYDTSNIVADINATVHSI
ncbi:peptidoglycan-binding protein LysM [Flavobacterium sp. TSSA_36]|uniref:peptidoglycan-binding protein LysM n=1 Tax=Flavobacterium sp. TSSA_36 TaxID=3447669 RepID=UPI003F362685